MDEQRQDKKSVDLRSKVGRDIADAQPLVAMARSLMRVLPKPFEERCKTAVLTKKPGIFHARQIVKRKEIIAVRCSVLFGQSAA